jgi:hypothetical protein
MATRRRMRMAFDRRANLGKFARPPVDPEGKPVQVLLTLSRAQVELLDRHRGRRTRQDLIRSLVEGLEP